MNASDAVRAILKQNGRTAKSLALDLGITPQALDNRLKKDMKVKTLAETVEALGYKILIVEKSKTGEGYEINASADEGRQAVSK